MDVSVRKSQKAGREKLRREKLNEHFVELGKVIDPDRPKNDKATILTDTVQLLKELTSEFNKLKSEYTALTDESRELAQEKNELREEKTSLKSDIENLNLQYQQKLRSMSPWGAAMDHTVMMAPPPSFPYPVPVAMPPVSIPMHPSMSAYTYFGNHNPSMIPAPCPAYMPYMPHNTVVEQQSVHIPLNPGNSSREPRTKVSREKAEESNGVATQLELKTPGSTSDKDALQKLEKRKKSKRNSNSIEESTHSSKCSSSPSVRDNGSSSTVTSGGQKPVLDDTK